MEMTLDHSLRNRRFLERFPEDFLADVVKALVELYPETYDAAREFPLAYARYLRPHFLRTKAELSFLALAQKHAVPASTSFNSSLDAHALVAEPPFVGTLSRLPYRRAVPRRATFRRMYASYHSMAQYPLAGLGDGAVPLQIDEGPVPEYVIFGHGSASPHARDIAFVVVNFVGATGRYVGRPIDLLSQFGGSAAPVAEETVRDVLGIAPKTRSHEEAVGGK
ncbi:MAG: hypothetical protein HY875_10285 [Chloroflexi bacterium]|nr:hypothetical protein [Chloroflexota bacterium]